MSAQRRGKGEIALKATMCPRCEARPGERCRTVGGQPAHMHASRVNPLFEAWRNGYADRMADERGAS